MNFIDFFVIIVLILGLLIGFKRGFIKSVVMLVGTILVVILAFYLKNPLATLMYEKLPFFDLKGALAGVTVINILIYEGIAFIIVLFVLAILFKFLLFITKIVDKLLNSLIVLTLPSKILGMIVGLVEAIIILFLFLFISTQVNFFADDINNSKYGHLILKETPFLSGSVEKVYKSVEEIYSLKDEYKDSNDKKEFNKKALHTLLKHAVLDVNSADKLVEMNKLKIDNAKEIIDLYR